LLFINAIHRNNIATADQISRPTTSTHLASRILSALFAAALNAVSASCLLKYMWWTACYSAWNGVPKLAAQWRMAGANRSFNGWGFILLEAIAIATLFSVLQFRGLSGFVRLASRVASSLVLAAACTAAFALILSVAQIGVR